MEQQPPASALFANTRAASDPLIRHSEPPRKRHRWIWIVVIAVFAIAVVLILRHKPGESQGAQAHHRFGGTVTLNAVQAHTGTMAVKLLSIGTVTPTYTASITAQVTGKIIAVHYREGQFVSKGAPLIDIDPRPYKAALDTAQGALTRDQGLLAQAKMDLDRYQAAWTRNAIAKQTLDDQAKLVDQDEGLVRSDQGTLETAQVNLAYCHIVAPISGKVGLRLVDPGNLISANGTTTLVVIAEVNPITIVFTIPEDDVPQVEAAMRKGKLQVTALDRDQKSVIATGTLTTTDNEIDSTTGTLKLRANFANPRMALFPNQFVNTQLLVNLLPDQVLIPNSAVQRNGTQAYVYVLNKNAAALTNIKVVQTDGVNSSVTGIQTGDMLANSSFEKLQNKSKVRIVKQKISASDDSESNTP
jgi:multidrug efflux system membrane fusion protein